MSALNVLAVKTDVWLRDYKRDTESSGHVALVERIGGTTQSYGTAKSTIARWRTGQFPPGHLANLKKLLGITTDELVEIIAGVLGISIDGVWGLARITGIERTIGRGEDEIASWRELLAMVRGEA